MRKKKFLFMLLLVIQTAYAQEYASRKVHLGKGDEFQTNSPLDVTRESSESQLYYLSSDCFDDDLVTRLAFIGYNPGSEHKRHVKVKAYHGNDECIVVFDDDCTIPPGGSATEPITLLDIELQQPVIVKNNQLSFVVESMGEVTSTPVFFKGKQKGKPIVTVTVMSEVVNHEGTVTDQDGNPIRGACVCIYRDNNDGYREFEFKGTTDPNGCYSIKVEESNCTYGMSVEADGFTSHVVNTSFAVKEGVKMAFIQAPKDITLWERLDFKANKQATIILPDTPDASWGRYYRMDRQDGWDVIFEREEVPKANTPYVIFPDYDFTIDLSRYDITNLPEPGYVMSLLDINSPVEWGFHGSYRNTDFIFNNYIKIFDTTSDCWSGLAPYPARIGAFRAYLVASSATSTHYDAAEARFIFVGEQTGISDITETKSTTSMLYDLQGRLLQGKPEKGMYIKNGKKYMTR